MDTNTGFILKVLIASAALSVAIAYGGPMLPILPTTAIALIAVFAPSLILAGLLSWRAYLHSTQPKAKETVAR